jgi:hypothetical protein
MVADSGDFLEALFSVACIVVSQRLAAWVAFFLNF